jgi:ATP-binding cassette, subfamily B, bacterial PglK
MIKKVKSAHEIITNKYNIELVTIFSLFLFSSLFEVLGISLLIPIIDLIISTENNIRIPIFGNFFKNLDPSKIIFFISLVFIIKTFFQLFLTIFQNNTLVKIQNFISQKLINNFFLTKYVKIRVKNKSEIIRNVLHESRMFSQGFLLAFLKFCSEIIQILFLLTLLVIFNTKITLLIFFLSISFFLVFDYFLKPIIKKISEERHLNDSKLIEKLNNIIGAFKEIRLFGIEKRLSSEFYHSNTKYLNSLSKQNIINQSIKFIIELLVILLFLCFLFYSLLTSQGSENLSYLAVVAIIIIRLTPVSINVFSSYQRIRYFMNSVDLIKDSFLNIEKDMMETKNFNNIKINSIELIEISLKFKDLTIFNKANITINRGDFIGLYGNSGVGKSTFADILMGFLKPDSGKLKINGQEVSSVANFRKSFSYISENSFIINDTIKNNIVFYEKYDESKFIKICNICNIDKFINDFQYGYDTQIGEDINNLSSGQRQRVCIARSLYRDSHIIICDEATNFLDNNNEKQIIENIKILNNTRVLISHNLNNLKFCDKVYELNNGLITEKKLI